jgi:predicted benzoate:H+ symporter BenE
MRTPEVNPRYFYDDPDLLCRNIATYTTFSRRRTFLTIESESPLRNIKAGVVAAKRGISCGRSLLGDTVVGASKAERHSWLVSPLLLKGAAQVTLAVLTMDFSS